MRWLSASTISAMGIVLLYTVGIATAIGVGALTVDVIYSGVDAFAAELHQYQP